MQTTIPFQGFYNSEYSEMIDYAIEMAVADDHGDTNPAIAEKLFYNTDYKAFYKYAAKLYADHFADIFELNLTFTELDSPREYNFTTDRIFCEIELSEVERIYNLTDKDKLRHLVISLFTSYDGFSSFYSNDLDQWGTDLSKWDHNQVGTLIRAYAESSDLMDDFDIYDLRESIDDAVYDYVKDADRLYKLSRYLWERELRHGIE